VVEVVVGSEPHLLAWKTLDNKPLNAPIKPPTLVLKSNAVVVPEEPRGATLLSPNCGFISLRNRDTSGEVRPGGSAAALSSPLVPKSKLAAAADGEAATSSAWGPGAIATSALARRKTANRKTRAVGRILWWHGQQPGLPDFSKGGFGGGFIQ
jgi:hypothetical protein